MTMQENRQKILLHVINFYSGLRLSTYARQCQCVCVPVHNHVHMSYSNDLDSVCDTLCVVHRVQ